MNKRPRSAWWVVGALAVMACGSDDQVTSSSQGGAGAAAAGPTTGGAGPTTGGGSASGGSGATGGGATGGSSSGGGTTTASGGAGGVDFTYDPTGGAGGGTSCAATEVKGDKPPVDIIVAIDNSGSMGDEAAQVRANINGSFADVLAAGGLDYRVVMISSVGTTGQAVCVAPPLGGPGCGDNPPIFRRIPRTISSSDALQRILCTYDGTAGSCAAGSFTCSATDQGLAMRWDDFLRFDALKVFIVITDDNSTSLPGAIGLAEAQCFDEALLAKPPAGMFGTAQDRKYTFYGIFGVNNGFDSTCPVSSSVTCSDIGGGAGVNSGVTYQALINCVLGKTTGHTHSSCQLDYSPLFQAIASDVVSQLSCEYTVPQNDPNGQAIDPEQVSVKFIDSSSVETDLPRVNDAAACTGAEWYYEDNLAPTTILLCPDACTLVQSDNLGEVKINVGCLQG